MKANRSRHAYWTLRFAGRLAGLGLVAAVGLGACAGDSAGDSAGNGAETAGNGAETARDDAETAGTTPDLATVPQRPEDVQSPEERQEIVDALIADREHARYSGQMLRGGMVPPANPPDR